MINLSRVLNSPRMRQAFTIHRSSGGRFGAGGWIEDTPTEIEASGIVWPSTAREILQVPEGDRVLGMMTFATPEPLYTTRAEGATSAGTSDQIEWHNELYRVISRLPFTDYGFNVAVGARLSGD